MPRHPFPVDGSVGAHERLAPALADGVLHLAVGAQELVDDLVARDDRRAVAGEGRERLGLAGADPTRDGDRHGLSC